VAHSLARLVVNRSVICGLGRIMLATPHTLRSKIETRSKQMGFRFRKSVAAGPLLRFNFSKRGASASVHPVKGLTLTSGLFGTRATASLPGTGFSYTALLGRNVSKGISWLVVIAALLLSWLIGGTS
jgi:hypothetical protein